MPLRELGLLASMLAYASPAPPPADLGAPDPRIQPEVYRHLDESRRHIRNGNWQLAMAHSEAVLCIDEIRYAVTFENADAQTESRCRKAIDAATQLWEQSLGNQVDFRESYVDPIVHIVFKESVMTRGRDVGGHVKWTRSIERLPGDQYRMYLRADIQVRTRQPNGHKMSEKHLTHVAMHELGHVLGLSDSLEVGDVMGPLALQEPVSAPQKHELRSILRIRETALELRRACLVTGIMELEGYNLARESR